MPSDYAQTGVPYHLWALPDLHDPVVGGGGSGGLEDSAVAYAQVAEELETAAGDLRAVLTAGQAAHEGEAAEASRAQIVRLASSGDAGVAQAKLAMYALQEQASYFVRVQADMRAAARADPSGAQMSGAEALSGGIIARNAAIEAAQTMARDAADLYQRNSNHNLGHVFQEFPPPTGSALDVSAASPAGQGAGGTAGGVGSGLAGGGAGAAGVGAAGVGPAGDGAGGAGLASAVPGAGGPANPGVGAAGAGGGTAGAASAGGAPPATPGGAAAVPAGAGGAAAPLPGRGGGRAGGGTSGTDGGPARPLPGSVPYGPQSTRPQPDRPFLAGGTGRDSRGSGWIPGQPWSSRPGRPEVLGGTGSGDRPSAGPGPANPRTSGGAPGVAAAAGPQRTGAATGHMPFMAAGAPGGRGQDSEHTRPAWLVEDDPESIWLSGLPPHTPGVIEP